MRRGSVCFAPRAANPPPQEFGRRCGPSVQAGIEKPLVGRQEDMRVNGTTAPRSTAAISTAPSPPRAHAVTPRAHLRAREMLASRCHDGSSARTL